MDKSRVTVRLVCHKCGKASEVPADRISAFVTEVTGRSYCYSHEDDARSRGRMPIPVTSA